MEPKEKRKDGRFSIAQKEREDHGSKRKQQEHGGEAGWDDSVDAGKRPDALRICKDEQVPVIRSPTLHATSTGGSSHQTHVKGKGKAIMEIRRSPHWDKE
ncbi:hypothetical protein J1N35_015346 [Gossypium stocksii]|uniref:Uncharacterized protein n=1 Tax=Gossypium stocksii TaxID=47602 RepID=A0A9D3VW06_9ROSI|nr:hypothetical protein J1N35_015346 [Gossypium stocksii]